jgi:hypothetical protein
VKKISLEGPTFNIFDILLQIREEYTHILSLNDLKLPKIIRNLVKSLAVSINGKAEDPNNPLGDIIRVDASKGGIYNNFSLFYY